MKKRTIKSSIAAVAAIALLLTGCSTAGSQPASSATSATTSASSSSKLDLSGVTLNVWSNTYANVLKAAGVDNFPYKVNLQTYTGGQLALQAMAADQLDLAQTSEIPPLFASLSNGGGNFKIIATVESNNLNQALIIGPNSKIKSVADLKGKKVGYIQATTSQYFLLKMLKEAGLTWKDITPVNLSPSDGLAALLSGSIQAFAVYGNQITADLQQGGKVLESAETILSGNYLYEASATSLKDPKKAAAIADYIGRMEKLNFWIRGHYDEYATLVADKFGMTKDAFIAYQKKGDAARKAHIRATTDKDLASLQDVADTFNGVGILEKKVAAKSLYSDQLADQITAATKQ